MRGKYLHNDVLIGPLDEAFRSYGARTRRERHVNNGSVIGAVDLFVEDARIRIAIEAELSARRVGGDLRKAEALRADELWILVPTFRLVRAVRRKLATLPPPPDWLDLFVLTQGQALSRVTHCLSLIAGA